jgi:mannobiose 2-epimerase
MQQLRSEAEQVLKNNILSFWMDNMIDNVNGGFYGQADGSGKIIPQADKGAISNARILWTFSAAYRIFKEEKYLHTATRAKEYLIENFVDKKYGGVYWALDYLGKPINSKKQMYAVGFAIYGLSEYARATGDKEAQRYAVELFEAIEEHSFDSFNNGYVEALSECWDPLEDMRLSGKDENMSKTMNTHLHIIESYTNLYRLTKDEKIRERIENLLYIFTEKILDKRTWHQQLFFSDDWQSTSKEISYGHDIEASWLLYEAASEIYPENSNKLKRIKEITENIADASLEGYVKQQGMLYESSPEKGVINAERHWWVQAETVAGLAYQYKRTGNKIYLEYALDCWDFIKKHLIDNKGGEWFWSIMPDGSINKTDDKAGFWKCPYHNGRMCMEMFLM